MCISPNTIITIIQKQLKVKLTAKIQKNKVKQYANQAKLIYLSTPVKLQM